MINSTVYSSPPIATRIYRDSSSWQIMNYVTSEPGEWSIPLIIQDMGGGSKAKRIYQMAFDRLISKGFVKNGKKTRRGYGKHEQDRADAVAWMGKHGNINASKQYECLCSCVACTTERAGKENGNASV